ncbi:MAG: acylneuraminate cytidylyltransferase family protein [Desulfovibrionaceae bacterium]|jgi:CMP-N-acetylneuraminic acid synthetase|nr:acylneuraminate cytidylyltransferase family protein [Desulfovibrionaceae bacterium]
MPVPSVCALIPARGGSKGVPKKNIRRLGGHPLLAYAIAASRLCPEIDRVVVSTDSEEIADVARAYGAEVPFMRPAEFARDNSPDLEAFVHAMDWFERHEGAVPDLLAHIRVTTPLRDPALVGEAVRRLVETPEATALRSAHELPEPPQKMFCIVDGFFQGFFPDDPRPEYYNLPRQSFPAAYHPNGYVDIVRTAVVRELGTLHGPRIQAFVTPHAIEVDGPEDFDQLEYRIARGGHPLLEHLDAGARS